MLDSYYSTPSRLAGNGLCCGFEAAIFCRWITDCDSLKVKMQETPLMAHAMPVMYALHHLAVVAYTS